jgi:hypothetical protein
LWLSLYSSVAFTAAFSTIEVGKRSSGRLSRKELNPW